MMNRISKTLTAALALGGALVSTGSASAQPWGNPGYAQSAYGAGYEHAYYDRRGPSPRDRLLADTTCSGQRGFVVEHHLHYQMNLGRLHPGTAARIQRAINDLQFEEKRECRQRDFAGARNIGAQYMRIAAWIDREALGYRRR
jgi:hypothetical protein